MSKAFKPSDYNSGQGMLTKVWGPPLWHVLHTISFNYPVNPTQKQQREYKRYFLSLRNVLPCKHCRENFNCNSKSARYSEKVFKNRNSFSRFVYRFHNSVNKALGKEKYKTYEEIRDRYEHFRSRCGGKKSTRKKPVKSSRKRRPIEKGCVEPARAGKKGMKCVLNIISEKSKRASFSMSFR